MSAATATTLRIASNRWARPMLGRKPLEQDWLAWIRACNSFTQKTRKRVDLPDWPARACRAVHGWHGHMARSRMLALGEGQIVISSEPYDSFSWAAWSWRSECWWRAVQALREQGEVGADTVHSHRGVWQQHSEHTLCLAFGCDWHCKTADRTLWRRSRDIFEYNWLQWWQPGTKRRRLWQDIGMKDTVADRHVRRRLR